MTDMNKGQALLTECNEFLSELSTSEEATLSGGGGHGKGYGDDDGGYGKGYGDDDGGYGGGYGGGDDDGGYGCGNGHGKGKGYGHGD